MATVGSLAVVLTASATDFERSLGRAARAVKSTEKEFMRSARTMERIGRDWTYGVTLPIVAGITAIGKAALDWESHFAGVEKTVDATSSQLAQLEQSLRNLAKTMPVSHKELAGIAETAGQLGLKVQHIKEFTRVIAMMGAATKMTSEETAIGMAQIANVMQTGQQSFDRMGATIVHLGNNLNTNESTIMDFGKRIAAAGRLAGFTEAQVLSTAGAFASAGIEAEAGGTAVSKVLASITEAVATGNAELGGFANVSGLSAAEFATAWQEDAGSTFARFVEGLGKSGKQAYGILRELGLNDERLKRAFLSAAGAQTSLISVMEMGTKAWAENNALVQEAEKRFKTGISRLKMLWNRIYDVAIVLGDSFAPAIDWVLTKAENIISVIAKLVEWFAKLPKPIRMAAGSSLLLIATIGPTYLALGFLNKTIALSLGFMAGLQAFAANAAFAFAAWRGGAATLGQSLVYLVGGPLKAVILGFGAAIIVGILLLANWEKVKRYAIVAWNVISAAVLYGTSLIVRGIGLVLTAIGYIVPSVRGAGQALAGLADHLKASAGGAFSAAKSAAATVKTVGKAAETQDVIAKAGESAANAQDELTNAIEGAGKAARKNLMGFDEINQLQSAMGGASPEMGIPEIPAISAPEIPQIGMGGIGNMGDAIGEQVAKAAETAASAWDKVKKAMKPVNKIVKWMIDNWPTIGPIVEGIASVITVLLVPALVKSGIEALIAAGKHVVAWLLAGAAALKNAVIMIGQLVLLIAKWAWSGVQALFHAGKIILAWALQGLAAVAQGAVMIGQFVLIIAKWAWAGVQALFHAAQMAAAWVIALGPVAWITVAVIALAILIIAKWDWIKQQTVIIWSAVVGWVVGVWNNIKNTAGSVFNTVKNSIIDAFEGVKARISGIWSGIWDTIKGYINKIIGGVNSMIRGLNRLSFSAPDWVPVIGGKSFGISIPTIPYLATGTNYVPNDMLAYLHEGEAVVPRKYNPAAVSGSAEVPIDLADTLNKAVYSAIRDAFKVVQSDSDRPLELTLIVDKTVLGKVTAKSLKELARQSGANVLPV